ncbi:hypothetical protein [Streptococcus infantis]
MVPSRVNKGISYALSKPQITKQFLMNAGFDRGRLWRTSF